MEQLREKEEQYERDEEYRHIFDATGDGLLIADFDGCIVAANAAACRIYRYPHDELVGLNLTALVQEPYVPQVLKDIRAVQDSGSLRGQVLNRRKDGTLFPMEVHATRFTYRGTPHLLSVIRDVTERVQAEQELRKRAEQLAEREVQYRRIFESSSDGVIINDPTRGVVVEANPAVCRMHGYSYEEFVGLHATEFIHPDYHPVFVDFLETIVAGGTYQCEAVDTRKGGTSFHVEVHGSSVMYQGRPHILALVRDITERVQARELLEQRVEERTRELSTLLDVSRTVTSTLQLEPLLNLILDQLNLVADNDGITLLEVRDDEFVVLLRRVPGHEDQEFPFRYSTQTHGPIWHKLRRGEVVIIGNVRRDDPLARAYRNTVGDYLNTSLSFERSFMAVPLMVKDRIIGLLGLTSARPNYYTPHQGEVALAIAQQAAIAIENARLYEQAQEMAIVEERQRLSRELHDSVSQALYSIALGAKTARALVDLDPGGVADPLDFVLAQAERGLAEMRALIFELRPEALEHDGLVSALAKHVDAIQARHRLQVEVILGEEPEVALPAKEALYRIAQEALQNIIKHAQATQVRLSLPAAMTRSSLRSETTGRGLTRMAPSPGTWA